MYKILNLLLCVFLSVAAWAQSDSLRPQYPAFLEKASIEGYGAMNYYHFNWQTDTAKRDGIDNERFVLELKYRWNQRIRLNAEVEIEHGGTGVDLEFDRFEEFGEFEFDVTKGGEVLLEQLNLEFGLTKKLSLKVGRVKVPIGLQFTRDEPTDYLTAAGSEMESQILPENWTDNGISLHLLAGRNNRWRFFVTLVNGLDGSAFNSANWIKRGNQRRFEMVSAENFALCARADFNPVDHLSVGISAYGGNTSGNRPKPDLKVSTPLGIADVHLLYSKDPFYAGATLLYGALGNSEALTNQNRNLSNNLNVKRTPVGAAALGAFAEFGVVLIGNKSLIWRHPRTKFTLYGRYDYYDTMFRTEGLVFNNPRWERQSFTAGAVLQLIPEVQIKTQFSHRRVGAPAPTSIDGGTSENTIVAGFAFKF